MTSPVALFGKVPAAGDFVSIGAASLVGRSFQEWIQGENDQLSAKHRTLPQAPIRFVYRDPSASGVVVGVLAPSRDGVGRTFPLSVMAHLDVAFAADQLPTLPASHAQFLDEGAALLAESSTLAVRELQERLARLPLPSPSVMQAAHVWGHQALEATPGITILEALFGPLDAGMHYYGLHMFLAGCERVRGHDPGTASIYLDCPCADDLQMTFWLMLAKRQLAWPRATPSFFWTDRATAEHRLLVSLGSPGAGTLHLLADRTLRAERLWPTHTTSLQSIESSRNAIPPAQLRILEPPTANASALLMGLDPARDGL